MTENKFKEALLELSNKLSKIAYNGDLSDIGNDVGFIIAKYFDKANHDDLDNFITGLKHGVSLVDGTYGNPVIVASKFDEAVKYVQENYVNNRHGSFLLLGNVAELIEITTGEFISCTELEKYKKS